RVESERGASSWRPLKRSLICTGCRWVGGHFVRLAGRLYEATVAALERRRRLDLYHSGLVVQVPEGRFVLESAPIRTSDGAERGVVGEGPVGASALGPFRIFRYELRCWRY